MRNIRQRRGTTVPRLAVVFLLLALGACQSTHKVEGGASDNGGGGLIKLGLLF
jgi:hypothetical protein